MYCHKSIQTATLCSLPCSVHAHISPEIYIVFQQCPLCLTFLLHTYNFLIFFFLWAVHLWCPLHRVVFTISLNGYHLEYSFIVHLFSLSTVLLFSTAVWPLLIHTLGFCILFKNKIFFFFFFHLQWPILFNAFFSSTVSQLLWELAERVGENITEWKLWWSSEISVLLY